MQDPDIITGTVVRGEGVGKTLGYPTANLEATTTTPRGVYGGTAMRLSDNTTYKAGIVIGAGDTQNPPKIEAHLLDFSGNLYGETLTLHIQEFIRPIKTYTDNETLKKDIAQDLERIKNIL